MDTSNRFNLLREDFIFAVVEKPKDWSPKHAADVPPESKVISCEFVASYAEARDDMLRCNRIAIEHELDAWAVVFAPSGQHETDAGELF